MYERFRQSLRMLSSAPQFESIRAVPTPSQKELEIQAWKWLAENKKLGVGDLVR